MSRIDELITELCPDGVEYRTIGAIADCYSGATPNTKKPEYWENGAIPWMSSGDVNLGIVKDVPGRITDAGFSNCSTKTLPANTVVVALAGQGKTRGKVALTKIELCTNQSLCGIVLKDSSVLPEYLYRYLDSRYDHLRLISNGDGTRGGLTLKMIRSYEIPVPPIEVQREVVRVLDAFTSLTDELTAKLAEEATARRQQYAYYRDRLLSRESLEVLDGKSVEMVKLSDICLKISSGKNKTRSESGLYPVYGSTGLIARCDTAAYSGEQILVARVGANAGKTYLATGDYDVSDNTLILEVRDNLNIRYLLHVLVNADLNQYAKGGGQPLLTAGQLKAFDVLVPSLVTQQKVVDILDRFDALTTSLTDGIPVEIEARKAQYGYYRDRLLDFPRKSGDAS